MSTVTEPTQAGSIAEARALAAQQDASRAPGQFLPAPAAVEADVRAAVAGAEADGPAWLAAVRRAGAAAFARQGFPTTRHEDWHYTTTAAIAEADYASTAAATGDVEGRDALRPFTFGQPLGGPAGWPTLVFVNGRFDAALSARDRLPEGVEALAWDEALTREPELVERTLGRIADPAAQPFVALNQAVFTDGALVVVRKEMEADRPVHLLFVTDATAARTASHARVLVVAERHSKVSVIESHVAIGGASYLTNAVTEIDVADGATVHHLKVQRESARAFHLAHVEARQGRDSHFVSFSFATGAKLARANVYTLLAGEGCGATLNGLYTVGDEQHCDNQTRIEHREPNCYSRELYKGVLDGRAHGVFNGKVYVHPAAQKTDGKQTNNTLLLSEEARIDTKPQLEIFADDVKCTHGATVGRLDQTALFYMQSRGVGTEAARKLLTYAFAADVLETIELEPVKHALEALVLERYAG
ncbi:MAG TPA: Fe-S cluster assembly protein SufD [Gemmatirosa sp.]